MEEWKEILIGDLGTIITGKTPKTSIKENYGGEIPFLTPSDDMSFRSAPKTKKTITQRGLSEVKNCLIPKDSICVSCIGSVGYVVITKQNTVTNQQINSIILKDGYDVDFIYYLMTIVGKDLNRLSQTSTAVPIISKSTFSNTRISVPSLKVQKRISSILKSLDDKIENNRKINENLEQQAQALFKSWFVDFEPFREQPFVESELGMIPEGWRVDVFDSIIKDIIPGDWGKEKEEGNYTHKVACVRGCDFQDIKNGLRGKTPERYILEKNYTAKRFQDHDVLVEISGGTPTISTGRVCPISQKLIELYDSDIVCTNFCKVIRPMKGYGAFLYYSWLYKFNNKVMFGYENGTSGIKNFRLKDFTSIEPVVIPPLEEIARFQELIDTIHMQIQMRGSESSRLSHLRDTLLPKLMSGEIKL